MHQGRRLTLSSLQIAGLAILALFLIPGLTYGLSTQILGQWDARFTSSVMRQADKVGRKEAEAYIEHAKPSVVCYATAPALAKAKADACATFSNLWQVSMAQALAIVTMLGGVLLLGLVLALSLAAFGHRSIQYLSFVTGKHLMTWACAVEILAQGTMLVWLSYWVTAFYFNIYIVKLILVAAVLVAVAAFAAIAGIFKRDRSVNRQHGELIRESDAPLLWARIRQMAERLKTAPPQQIVAGIDSNFFVTEAPLQVGTETLRGRTLYVSLPLLRKLDTDEADAVLAHELAHLSGGDTANSARLGPAILHYDQYCAAMRSGGATFIVWPILALYRIIFEVALARSRRRREFQADRVAAALVSPQAIGKSLVKVAAYSIYRNKVERDIFNQRTQHTGALGIASTIDRGLADYVQSPAFMDQISTVHVPHPFDSHPPLSERMQAVGVAMGGQEYADVAMETPTATWASEIAGADAIEGRLWQAFDAALVAHHERALAYRYQPIGETERALVLKYFPDLTFDLKNGARIEVSHEGIRSSTLPEMISWDAVQNLQYKSGTFGDSLAVTARENARTRKLKIGLPQIGKRKGQLQGALALYWQRHKVMRQLQAADVAAASAAQA